jgi:hypothetical protein
LPAVCKKALSYLGLKYTISVASEVADMLKIAIAILLKVVSPHIPFHRNIGFIVSAVDVF